MPEPEAPVTLPTPDPGNRLTTETTTRDTPQGTVQTQVVEQRTVQQGHVGYFEETEGVGSITRVLSAVAMGAAIVFGGLACLLPQAAGTGLTLAGMFLTGSGAIKLVGRALEDKSPLKE